MSRLKPLTNEQLLTYHLSRNLRRAYRYSPVKRLAKAKYQSCIECGSSEALEYDHRIPVVPTGMDAIDLNPVEYFMRMFCIDPDTWKVDLTNLVALCFKCHKQKSGREAAERAANGKGAWSERAKAKRAETRARRAKRKKAKRSKAKKARSPRSSR